MPKTDARTEPLLRKEAAIALLILAIVFVVLPVAALLRSTL